MDKVVDDGQVDIVIMAFAKAFDKAAYQRLLSKLHHYGIQDSDLDCITDFMTECSQRVMVDDKASQAAPVTSGMPQSVSPGSYTLPMLHQ